MNGDKVHKIFVRSGKGLSSVIFSIPLPDEDYIRRINLPPPTPEQIERSKKIAEFFKTQTRPVVPQMFKVDVKNIEPMKIPETISKWMDWWFK
jgi:hypothetical protein